MSPPETETASDIGSPAGSNSNQKIPIINNTNSFAYKAENIIASNNHLLALEYARAAIPVFPCSAALNKKKLDQTGYATPLKSPLVGGNWLTTATTDVETIDRWWFDHPDALVGLPCKPHNLLVIDADQHGDGADGVSAFKSLIDEHGGLPPNTVIVETQSGGKHYILRQPEGMSLGNGEGRLPKGINVRGIGKGDGGYIIAPKTIWLDPEGSARSWDHELDSPELLDAISLGLLPAVPDWLIALLIPTKKMAVKERVISGYDDSRADVSYPSSEAERLRIKEALLEFNPDDYDDWLKVGAALHDSAHSWARDVWDEYSRRSSKYDPAILDTKWDSFGTHPNPARIPSLVALAQERRAIRQPKTEIQCTTFRWRNPSTIPPREWLYGKHYIRGYTTATIAPAGVGKSRNAVAEAVAMASGLDFLGSKPVEPLRVHYWNGEDPQIEIERQVIAAHLHYGLSEDVTGGRLSFDSGRQNQIKIAVSDGRGFKIATPIRDALIKKIREDKIDVLIIDPFVSVHAVSENDNNAIDAVSKEFSYIAEATNCSIELIHHTRKTGGGGVSSDDSRGASALLGTVRSMRVINVMTAEEARSAKLSEESRRYYFRLGGDKANLAPLCKSQWFHIASVDLRNPSPLYPEGDNVGVVEQWTFPSASDDISNEDVHRVLDRMGDNIFGASKLASDWLGKVIAEVLSPTSTTKLEESDLTNIIKDWLEAGYLVKDKETVPDKARKRPVLRAGKHP